MDITNSQLHAHCTAPSVGALNSLVTTLVQAILTAQCAISPATDYPPDFGDKALSEGLDTYDFVVIGAGTAGSVVGSRLSENPDWKVLVLEAGGNPPQETEVPALSTTIFYTDYAWNYWTEGNGKACLTVRNESCYWPRGKVVGGTGAVNGMLFVRGNRQDYDGWLKAGNYDWGWTDVLHYFEKAVQPVGNATHPKGFVELNHFKRFDIEVQDMIYNGSAELGVKRVRQFGDDGSETGILNSMGTVKNGKRMSTGKVHLGKVGKRPNLRVIKHAHATKINFDEHGKTVKSVNFVLRGKHEMTVNISKELVVSAGAVESPKLLMLSGVGPREHLADLKIPLVKALNIGDNLQDHLMALACFEVKGYARKDPTEKDMLDNIYKYLLHADGPFVSQSITSLTSFINTNEHSSSPFPDIQYHFLLYHRRDYNSIDMSATTFAWKDTFRARMKEIIKNSHLLMVLTVLLNPKSKGNIRLRSANYTELPKITPNYLAHKQDVETLVRGIRHLMKLEATSAFRQMQATLAYIPIEECYAYWFKSDDYWRCFIKYFTTTLYHYAGSVKMGPLTDANACVDPRLRLYGVDNLRVADASIMPAIPSANTNAGTIMVGERVADFIRERWLGKVGHTK